MGFSRGYRGLLGKGLRLSAMAAGICVCGSLHAQVPGVPSQAKTMLVEPLAPLLPATLGKWQRVADGDVGDGLGQVDAADAAVLKEDGLKRFAKSEYVPQVKGAAASGTLTVYHFIDVSGATAAFDYFARPGQAHLDQRLVDQASCSNGCVGVLFRSGANVVREDLNSHGDTLDFIAHELIDHLPKLSGPAAMAPLLPTLLPAKGFDADSVKYALGPVGYAAMGGVLPADVVGFDKSAEAVTAKSKGGGMLTMLLYPTPQIAGEHGRMIESLMNQRVAAGGAERTAIGTVMMRREGPLVVMTTGAWSAGDAKAMVDGIHLNSEVSFDKPMPVEFHAEVRKTYSLLESIVIFCSISALAMVVLGLFFGGGRALIRVMQGKPAASEPEFLHIDLSGATGKRLGDPEA
jgi:hypothetical protein